jgi:hypothetical protein
MTRQEATDFLRARYATQVARFPRTARIPEVLYVRRNLRAAMAMTDPKGLDR